jgi:hypothetical protein
MPLNTHYLTIMGSHAYGVADTSVRDKLPDFDVYGFCIPPKEMIFPHLTGKISGFGTAPQNFENFQKHHIMDVDAVGGKGKEWDIQVFSIVRYFELCRQNNPNMVDSLFTPEECVIHCTNVGRMVRDNRHLFLSKESWKKFRGYAQSQLKKMNDKNPEGGRKEIVEKFGYDVKFAYHIIRLFDEVEQILLEGTINLQRAREVMKAIRRGDWTAVEVRNWAIEKEKALEVAYTKSTLPEHPDEERLLRLLKECLEEHYGSLKDCIGDPDWAQGALKEIDNVIGRYRRQLYESPDDPFDDPSCLKL